MNIGYHIPFSLFSNSKEVIKRVWSQSWTRADFKCHHINSHNIQRNYFGKQKEQENWFNIVITIGIEFHFVCDYYFGWGNKSFCPMTLSLGTLVTFSRHGGLTSIWQRPKMATTPLLFGRDIYGSISFLNTPNSRSHFPRADIHRRIRFDIFPPWSIQYILKFGIHEILAVANSTTTNNEATK